MAGDGRAAVAGHRAGAGEGQRWSQEPPGQHEPAGTTGAPGDGMRIIPGGARLDLGKRAHVGQEIAGKPVKRAGKSAARPFDASLARLKAVFFEVRL